MAPEPTPHTDTADEPRPPASSLDDEHAQIELQARLAEATTQAVLGTDRRGTIVVWNDEAARRYGWRPEQVLGQPATMVTAPAQTHEAITAFAACLRNGTAWTGEIVGCTADGSDVPLLVHVQPVLAGSGRPIGAIASSVDVRPVKAAEERQRFLARLLESVGESVIATDARSRITFWNRGAEELYGWTAEEAVGRTLTEMVQPLLTHDELVGFLDCLQRGERWEAEVVVHDRHGHPRTVLASTTPIIGFDGSIDGTIGTAMDVSARVAAEQAARESERRLADVVARAPVVLVYFDANGRFELITGRQVEDAAEVTDEELLQTSIFDRYAPNPAIVDNIRDVLAGREVRFTCEVNDRHWRVDAYPIRDDAGSVTGGVAVATEVTDEQLADFRLRALLEHVSDVISVHDEDGVVTYVSPSAARILGRSDTQATVGRGIDPAIHPDDRDGIAEAFQAWKRSEPATVLYRLRDGSGEWRTFEAQGTNLLDHPAVGGVVVASRDVTDRVQAERERLRHTRVDDLTGLATRPWFLEQVGEALLAAGEDEAVSVLVVDVDRFKLINESFGHQTGDEVLQLLGGLMAGILPDGSLLARLSGDEFAVVLPATTEQAVGVAEAIRAALTPPIHAAGRDIGVSVSIGIATGQGIRTPQGLLRDADSARNLAKRRGRDRTEVFTDELRVNSLRRLQVEAELRRGIAAGELRLFFQPLVRLASGRIVGAEALVRWQHPERGLLAPGEFITVAEETNLILPLGRWVLLESLRQAAVWADAHPEQRLTVSVNLSARQLSDPELVDLVRAALADTGADPATVCLEITESVLMDDAPAAAATLRRLKALGVKLAIDDFGTGYSSLAYLKRFTVDHLKIDRQFVQGLGHDPEDTVIVSAVAGLARSLGVDVVAEGVEELHQVAELGRLGCTFAQGYLWSPPVPADEFDEMLARHPGRSLLPTEKALPQATPSPPVEDAVALLAHELRNPVTVLKGYAENLMELHPDLPDGVRRGLEAIRRNTESIEGVLATLTDLEALEHGTLRLAAEPTDVVELVHDVVDDMQAGMPDHPVSVQVPAPVGLVTADPARVREIVVNLLGNAAKYTPPGPVEVHVERGDAEVVVRVVDHGPGIPPERTADVFRKFARLDRSKKGSGLGLFLCRAVARAHGGELSCHRPDGGGAEFRLALPADCS